MDLKGAWCAGYQSGITLHHIIMLNPGLHCLFLMPTIKMPQEELAYMTTVPTALHNDAFLGPFRALKQWHVDMLF